VLSKYFFHLSGTF